MERVCLETPYAGDVVRHIKYARACLADCLKRGESPFASHLLYTQEGVLDDNIPAQRELGIQAGLAWAEVASKSVFYVDLGISKGMIVGFNDARAKGRAIEFRSLPDWQRFYKTELPEGLVNPLHFLDFL